MLQSRRVQCALVLLAVLAASRAPLAQSVAIKLATVVPDGSIWDKSLKQMAADWKQASADRVAVTVFSGGSQGDESSVLRKMRLDALQAASLTVVGLAVINPAFNVFNVPFFFDSYDELNAVVDALTPTLKQRVEAKGFVLLNWGHGGWLQVFTKRPVRTVADLKGLKLYTSAGDDRMTQWYKANGFQPHAMAMTDVLTGLTTGMIEGLPTPPVAALAFQWNRQTPYMLDIGLAPVVGATVITRKTWLRIGEADRGKLAESALAVEKRLQADVPKQDAFAVMLMQQQGLTVTKADGPEWRQEGEVLAATMRGEMVPKDIFDLAVKARAAFRQARKTQPGTARVIRALLTVEDVIAGLALAIMVVLPLLEILMRRVLGVGVPASGPIVQHLTLWVGFLGAAIAAREGRLLSLATGTLVPAGLPRRAAAIFAAALGAAVAVVLASAAVELVRSEREVGTSLGAGIPTWIAQLVLPIGFALIALRLVWRASSQWGGRLVAAGGLVVGAIVAYDPTLLAGRSAWPGVALVILGGLLGAPIFAILGGAAVVLFMSDGVTPAAILIETYALSVSPTLAAIPLFTLTGFILAEGRASERLLRVFRSLFGWIPGGTAVVCAVLCSFFTAFTGGSGITILALGGILFPALVKDGYRERFALGLLTASGSLGLLLPPSLPLMLYGVVAQIPIADLFIGGLLPGILLTAMMSAWGMREGLVSGAGRQTFAWREARQAIAAAKWELALPVVVLAALFSGVATSVEAAALTAAYALVVQSVVHRDLSVRRDVIRVFADCVGLIGGVLVILGVAVGLTSWMVGAQVPMRLVEFTRDHIGSQFVFLLALNVFLLLVGCLMEIFPAIVVVVPLIVPLGVAFNVHPVHLGIIFIANLELGYLTPLVGLNILLASYRFKRPVLEVARASLPMAGILGAGVLVITYVPWLTLGVLQWLGRA